MAIPGYDPDDVEEALLEREADAEGVNARVAVVAATIPEHFVVTESETEPPPGSLSEPVDVRGLEELEGLDALQIELAYDPSKLPPGASPTDVAVAAVTGDGPRPFESEIDLEATTVAATMSDRPPATTLVAVADTDES